MIRQRLDVALELVDRRLRPRLAQRRTHHRRSLRERARPEGGTARLPAPPARLPPVRLEGRPQGRLERRRRDAEDPRRLLHPLGADVVVHHHVGARDEDAHWERAHSREHYYKPGLDYEDYAPAYCVGYIGHAQYGGRFEDAERSLCANWERIKGDSRLSLEDALLAMRAAWDRMASQADAQAQRTPQSAQPVPSTASWPRTGIISSSPASSRAPISAAASPRCAPAARDGAPTGRGAG